jgi:transcriptional regulator with XRE-family HTH domain
VERRKTQAETAQHIGMPLQTYKDWERGATKDIKTPYLLRAVRFLKGSVDQLTEIPDNANAEDGEVLARAWITSPLAAAVAEAQANGQGEAVEQFIRFLTLVAAGKSPADAAREVLPEQDQ